MATFSFGQHELCYPYGNSTSVLLGMKRLHPILAFAALVSSSAQAQMSDQLRSLMSAVNEQEALVHAGHTCKLVTDNELKYWYKQTSYAASSILNEKDQVAFDQMRVSPANMNSVESMVAQHTKQGCGAPELVGKVASLRTRLSLNGLSIKQLDEAYGRAVMDLHR